MIWKYWYSFSLFLLIYTLLILDDEAYSVYYNNTKEINENESLVNATFCFPLDGVLRLMNEEGRTKIERNETVFVPHLLRLAVDSLNSTFGIELDQLHSYFANNHTCFVVRSADLSTASYFQSIDFRVYPFEPEARPLFFEVMFMHRNNNLNFYHLSLKKVEVRLKRNKYTACEYDPRLENGMSFTFTNCLNACLKKSATKAIYLYEQTESLFVNLSDGRRDVAQELQCIKRFCQRDSCLMTSYTSFYNNDRDDSEPRMERVLFKYDAYYSLDGLDYYLQLIGVIVLFLNVSLAQLAHGLLVVAAKRIHSALKIQRIRTGQLMKGLKRFVTVASLGLLCFLSALIGIRYYQALQQPIASYYYAVESKSFPISIVLCVPVQLLINNGAAEPSESIERAILGSNSFAMIQNLTDDGLDKVLESPILVSVYESMERRLDYEVSKAVLFANGSNKLNQTTVLLERCFRIEFDLKETAYEYYMLSTEIILRTKPRFRVKIYPVIRDKKFIKISGTFKYKPRSKVHLYITQRSVNCTNYPAERPDLECTRQGHCVEKCIAENFLSTHSSLTTRAVIEKEQVARMRPNFNRLLFNRTPDLQIEDDCKKQFSQDDCEEQEFRESYGYGHREPGEYRINLYNVFIYNLQQSDNYEKLVLKFLNILSIIYGVSIKKILNFILCLGGFRLRHKRLCERLVLCATLTGFAYNVFVVFYQVMDGRQVASGTFEQPDTLRLPDIVFCVNILDIVPSYLQVTEHHQVTGRYLDELTSNYTLDSILAKLIYLNQENEFTEFTEFNGELGENTQLFQFQTYLFLNLKCWQISIKILYNLGDFFYLNDTYLVKFHLNRIRLPRFFYFAFKYPDSKEFTRIFKYSSDERVNRKVKFENFKQTEVEKFRLLKHPLAWFYERIYGMAEIHSITDYLDKLKNAFRRRHNRTTRQIVLEQEQFDYEIDERLFRQYYLQVQRQIDEEAMPKPLATFTSYESNFVEQHLIDQNATADFEIFSNLFIFHTNISNEDNFIKFVQDLLNAVSFSLGLCILDLHVCLSKSIEFVVAFYARLQRCRSRLADNLRL